MAAKIRGPYRLPMGTVSNCRYWSKLVRECYGNGETTDPKIGPKRHVARWLRRNGMITRKEYLRLTA